MAFNNDIKITLTLDGNQATYTAERFGQVLNSMVADIKKSADASKRLDDRFTGLGQTFRDVVQVGGMLRFVMYDIRDIFNVTFGAVVKNSAEIERMTKLMEGLSTATSKVAREQEALASKAFVFDMAKNAPFEVKTLSDAFVKLKSAGIDPTAGSMKTLVDSVAAFGGSSEQLKRASVAIQQMAGKGVISMEELRQQLGEAVPDAMKAMAVGTGLSMGDLVDKISKGQVEAKSALERMMAVLRVWHKDAAKEMMETWTGQFEKLKTNIALFTNQIGQGGAFKVLKDELRALNDFLESSDGAQFANSLGAAFRTVAEGLAGFIRWVVKFKDEIVLAGKLAIATWAGFKLNGAIRAMQEFGAMAIATYRRITVEQQASALAATRESEARIAAKRKEILQAAVMEAELVRTKRATAISGLAQLEANLQAERTVQQAAHQQMLLAQRVYETKRLESGKFASAAAIAAARAEAQAKFGIVMSSGAAIIAMEKEVAASRALINGGAYAQISAINAKARQEITEIGSAATKTAGAMGVLRGAMGLLGGPIGIITTLLTAGAFAWLNWGNEAEDAIDRANAAIASGTANMQDYSAKQSQFRDLAKRELELLEAEAMWAKAASKGPNSLAERNLKKVREDLAKVQGDMKNVWTEVGKAREQAIDGEIRSSVAGNERAVRKVLDSIQQRADTQLAAEQVAYDAGIKKNAEYSAAMNQITTNMYSQQIEVVRNSIAIIDGLMKSATGKSLAGYKAQKANLSKMMLELTGMRDSASKIGTQPDYVMKTPKGQGAGGAGKAIKEADDWLLKTQNDVMILGEKFKGVSLTLEQVEEFRGEAQARLTALLTEGGLDTTTGKGKNKKTTTPAAIPAGFVELEAIKLALQKYGADREREINAAIDRMNKLDDKIAREQAQANEARKNAFQVMTQPTVAIPSSVVAFRERLAAEIANIKQLFDMGILSKEEFDRRVSETNISKASVEASLHAETAMLYIATLREKREALEESLLTEKEQIVSRYERERAEIIKNANLAALVGEERVEAEKQLNAMLLALANKHARDMETPMQRLAREWKDVTSQMERATASWMDQGVDAIMNFVKTGKLEFGDLVESILSDMLRIQIQKQVAGAADGFLSAGADWLSGMMGGSGGGGGGFDWGSIAGSIAGFFGFANGGIMTNSGALELRKYANGGIANRPQLALYGEGRMPEAYVPLPDGRTIPVTMTGGMSGTVVNVNVHEAPGTKAEVQRKQNADGSSQIDIIIQQVESKISQNISKGRGSVASTLERTYGLNRAAGAYG